MVDTEGKTPAEVADQILARLPSPARIESMSLRLAALFVVGTLLGSLVNWAIYTFAWSPAANLALGADARRAPARALGSIASRCSAG